MNIHKQRSQTLHCKENLVRGKKYVISILDLIKDGIIMYILNHKHWQTDNECGGEKSDKFAFSANITVYRSLRMHSTRLKKIVCLRMEM